MPHSYAKMAASTKRCVSRAGDHTHARSFNWRTLIDHVGDSRTSRAAE
jgi:hypothetical protein